jgi:hypothetical protein
MIGICYQFSARDKPVRPCFREVRLGSILMEAQFWYLNSEIPITLNGLFHFTLNGLFQIQSWGNLLEKSSLG